jgi:hypothetical protein
MCAKRAEQYWEKGGMGGEARGRIVPVSETRFSCKIPVYIEVIALLKQ